MLYLINVLYVSEIDSLRGKSPQVISIKGVTRDEEWDKEHKK